MNHNTTGGVIAREHFDSKSRSRALLLFSKGPFTWDCRAGLKFQIDLKLRSVCVCYLTLGLHGISDRSAIILASHYACHIMHAFNVTEENVTMVSSNLRPLIFASSLP